MRVKVAVLMTIAGTLKTMALADIFQWVTVGEYTGTLVVSSGDISKSVYFKSGQIISCASNDPKEFLGHFLVSRGMISEADIPAAMEEQDRSGELLGRILVEQRAISQQDLDRMLSLKAEEAIYEIVRWPYGDFHFIDNVLPEHELVPVSVDANGLIFEGLRRRDEWTLIEKIIPDPACVPVSVADLLVDVEDEAARTVLSLVDDDRSVEDICLQTHSSEFCARPAKEGSRSFDPVSEVWSATIRSSPLKPWCHRPAGTSKRNATSMRCAGFAPHESSNRITASWRTRYARRKPRSEPSSRSTASTSEGFRTWCPRSTS
jgi:hypothetical protein